MFVFDPYSPAIDADPFPAYKTLRDEYPCFWSPQAGTWVLSRYADIVSAGQDWQTYSSAKGSRMRRTQASSGRVVISMRTSRAVRPTRWPGAASSISSVSFRRSSRFACCSPRSACQWATSRRCATRRC